MIDFLSSCTKNNPNCPFNLINLWKKSWGFFPSLGHAHTHAQVCVLCFCFDLLKELSYLT
ncbi:hypothetical protein Hanom_Chr14g01287611 [Helianthus anomalus]